MPSPGLHRLLAMSAALSLGVSVAGAQVATSPSEEQPAPAVAEELAESASGLWIVHLEDDPVPSYRGGTDGLRATSPRVTAQRSLDLDSPDIQAYREHLVQLQEETARSIEDTIGRDVEIEDTYQHALNAMAVRVSAEEAQVLADLPGISSVEPDQEWRLDTDVSNEILGTPAIWDGDTGAGLATRGEGIIVGMLDTGVNPAHPSFAAVDGDGYAHQNPYGAGVYVGVCAPEAVNHEDLCNDKLIGAYNFTAAFSAADDNGHGSHVGATMAGNQHDAVFSVGADEYTRSVSGVAPRANVISYKVCTISCLSTASVAAVEQAILDGTDVLNYSISGPDNPWFNAVDLAFLAAYDAGIFVSASAGNDGPGEHTVAKTAPWNATVAATNSPRLIAHDVSVVSPPSNRAVHRLAGVPGSGPAVTEPLTAELREASEVDPANGRGCDPFPAGAFDGALALIERGDCNFSVKVGHAAAAGAVGVIMVNQFVGPPVVMGGLENTTIPSVMLSNAEGTRLRDFVVSSPGDTQVLLDSSTVLTTTADWSRMVADFSSRGPSTFDLLAPTFAAPGRNILAATAPSGGESATYEFMQGTSMAAPHGAGAGALLMALHPEWSPAQVRSALASTADDAGLLKDDGTTPADPYDVGSGLLDLDGAGRTGLVLEETTENFIAANPAQGGDPTTLNLPAFVDQNCLGTCTFTRELTSVADAEATYTATVVAPEGVGLSIEPTTFTIAPGQTQVVTVSADVSDLVGGEPLFGQIRLDTDSAHLSGAAVADVHYPVVLVKGEAEMVVSPVELSSLLGVDEVAEHTLTVTNAGGAPMQWSVTEEDGCALPDWVSIEPASGEVAAGQSQPVTVTFDSSDLAGAEYAGTLCLASNDPHTPVATVGLTLEVVEIPVIEVSPESVTATLPAGSATTETLTVANTGYGVLEWTVTDPEAGPSEERIELLRDGVLLVPNSGANNRGVMAFDTEDGTLIDETFIPHYAYDTSTLYTPNQVVPNADGTGFLVADQIRHVVTEYDLEGNFRGFFAPTKEGPDTSIMQNVRGLTWSPQGTLLVTVATGVNANSIIEFDAAGTYLGHFIEPGADGLVGPWFILFRDEDVLVTANGSQTVHSFSLDGESANPPFAGLRWPEQAAETPEGTVLVANWSTATGAPPQGIHEYSATGEHLGHYTAPGSSYAGVYPLGNGNILTTTANGVYEIDRSGEVVELEQSGGRGRFITEVVMPDLLPCLIPDEVPWLEVVPGSGQTGRDEATQVEVQLDSSGLDVGEHRAQLCVSSNDPARSYVPVLVALTVTEAGP